MLPRTPLPESTLLKRYLDYDPVTGIITCKERWGGPTKTGQVLGYTCPRGYVFIRFQWKLYPAHRLIYRMVTGIDPEQNEVDHENGNKSDNAWKNLRLATHSQNNQNTPLAKNNKSGAKGISWSKQKQMWRACISVGPRGSCRQVHCGFFDTVEEAEKAVKQMREKLHGGFTNHGTFPTT